MSIVAADIKTRISTTAGAAGNSTAPGAAGTSLGKYITNADLIDNVLNNLFPDVTGAENAASNVDYQCQFIYNSHGTLTWQSVVVWISAETAGGSSWAIGVDTTAASAVGGAGAQALTIANKNTAPAGVTFSAPTTQATGIAVGDIPAGQVKAIWIRRTSANTSALAPDSATLSYAGDTL
jgi:hypothetical protein